MTDEQQQQGAPDPAKFGGWRAFKMSKRIVYRDARDQMGAYMEDKDRVARIVTTLAERITAIELDGGLYELCAASGARWVCVVDMHSMKSYFAPIESFKRFGCWTVAPGARVSLLLDKWAPTLEAAALTEE